MKKIPFLKIIAIGLLSGVLLVFCILGSYKAIAFSAKDQLYSSLNKIPTKDVALVLGANKKSRSGRTNLFFRYRMKAAAQLYKAGKVKHILVSGDNHIDSYDEASDMHDYLVRLGVPSRCITLDYAGFRTLDSVVRAKEVFCLHSFTIVSQQFHNERALFLCNRNDIDAIAFNAKDVPTKYSYKTKAREYLARCKAILDTYILFKSPKYLGKKEPIKL